MGGWVRTFVTFQNRTVYSGTEQEGKTSSEDTCFSDSCQTFPQVGEIFPDLLGSSGTGIEGKFLTGDTGRNKKKNLEKILTLLDSIQT